MTQNEFIEKSNIRFNNKFDYSKVVYQGNKKKVCIICPTHGEFWQRPNNHLSCKNGCFYCGCDSISKQKNKK